MTSTPDDPVGLERQITQHQQHLASTVDELASRVAPKALARAGAQSAQAKARDVVLDENGSPRVERLAVVGGALVTFVGGLIALSVRRRRKRRRSS
jgi:hypothetical protein